MRETDAIADQQSAMPSTSIPLVWAARTLCSSTATSDSSRSLARVWRGQSREEVCVHVRGREQSVPLVMHTCTPPPP
jgi:hypothetical protein